MAGNPSTLEQRVARVYTAERVEELKRELLSAPACREYRALLRQTFEAANRQQFLIAVPALFAVLEGVFAKVESRQGVKVARWAKDKEVSVRAQYGKSMHAVIWYGIRMFIERVAWKPSSFQARAPSRLNRHWTLHGREMSRAKKADFLRLLQAIAWIARES